jgi:hypothetical protein
MQRFYFLLLVICAVMISACEKERFEFVKDKVEEYRADVYGIVKDEAGLPVAGAKVSMNGTVTTTDKNGVYLFDGARVNNVQNTVTVTQNGFFEGNRSFLINRNGTAKLEHILLAQVFNQSFPAANGGQVKDGAVTLDFPANAIMVEATGATYQGTVQVAIRYVDPLSVTMSEEMPGNMTGLNEIGQVEVLQTFGMMAVELRSPSGEKLQVKTGMTVKATADIVDASRATAPAAVPMWHFDLEKGYWIKEGQAVRKGDTYEAQLSHFSWWNYDISLPSVIAKGRVLDQDGNALDAHVWFIVPGQFGGHGNTHPDGTFIGPVSQGVVMTLKIIVNSSATCSGAVVYSQQVGPYNADVDLGDITVTLPQGQQFFTIEGEFVDCNDQPVTSGYVILDGDIREFVPLVNGQLNYSTGTCLSNLQVTLVGFDEGAVKVSNTITLNGLALHNVGQVKICQALDQYLEVKNATLGINNTYLDFNLSSIDSVFKRTNFLEMSLNQNKEFEQFLLEWDSVPSGNPIEFLIGSYPLKNAWAYYLPSNISYGFVSGTVNITKGGVRGEYVEGNYTMVLFNGVTNSNETFSGSFRKKV